MSVIFSRAPLRISLGGGGTDLPSYYREHSGFLVAGAIDKYVYMLVHTVFQRRYRMKYSAYEEVDAPSEIHHPILRETLLRYWNGAPLEIASVADVPSGTGLGSSGAYTVCLLKALAQAKHTPSTPHGLAEAACHIEIDVLGEPIGKQDQYVAAHGGICAYTFHPSGDVEVEPLELAVDTLDHLRERLLLFFTGDHALGIRRSLRPERTVESWRSFDDRKLASHQRDGFRKSEAVGKGRPSVLRGSHARTLGEQTQSIAWNGERPD